MVLTEIERRRIWSETARRTHRLWKKRDPEGYRLRQVRAAKSGTSEQRARAGRLGGLRFQELYPNLSSDTMKRTHEKYPNMAARLGARNSKLLTFEQLSSAGKKGGRVTAESGKLALAPRHSFLLHRGHYHRSNPELEFCKTRMLPKYGSLLHVNVHFGSLELDWIVGLQGIRFNRKNPYTWSRVIEHHKVRFWRGETTKAYKQKRIKKLRDLGVKCPIEVICF